MLLIECTFMSVRTIMYECNLKSFLKISFFLTMPLFANLNYNYPYKIGSTKFLAVNLMKNHDIWHLDLYHHLLLSIILLWTESLKNGVFN